MKRILLLSLFVAVISSCTSMKDTTGKSLTITGTLEKSGITTYQYGTHVLKTEDKTYALKADFNLDTYIDKKVTITGKKVTGYPLEGGPELVQVTLVKF